MRNFWKISVFAGAILAYLGYHIHQPIPVAIPDYAQFQCVVDILSAAEFAATITEWLGFSYRWWSYPGNIDIGFPMSSPENVELQFTTFADVDCMIITPNDFKTRSKPGPALLYLHGGGWVFGSLNNYKVVFEQAASETGFIVIAPEYKKAPQFPFPVPFEDCLNTAVNVMKRASEFNIDPNKIVIIGDSAGGNLAMAITLELIKMKKTDSAVYAPAMTTLIYPVLQMANYLTPSQQQNEVFIFYKSLIPKFWLAYIGLNDRMDLSPIIAVNGHIREEMKFKVKVVDSSQIPDKYKIRGYNSSEIPLTNEQQMLLDNKSLEVIEKSYMNIRIAPLMASDEELANLPRIHILVCEYDTIRDDGILLYERLKKLGKDVTLQYIPDALHASLNVGSLFPRGYFGEQNKILYRNVRSYMNKL